MNLGNLPLVLVIDDDPDQLDLVRVATNHAGGLRMIGAESGAEAMIQLDARRTMRLPAPDLVLTDLKMPGMNGVQVMQALRERSEMKNIPFFFLTSTAYDPDRSGVQLAGANGFFQKPVRFDGLVALMRTLSSHLRSRYEFEREAAAAATKPD